MAFDLLRRRLHSDFERVADASAKKLLKCTIHTAVDASLDGIGSLAVALRELIDELFHLAELAKDELRAEGVFVLTVESEIAEGDRGRYEGFHLGVEGGVLVHTRDGLVPGEDLDDGKGDGGREVGISGAGAAEENEEFVNCSFVGGEDGVKCGKAVCSAVEVACGERCRGRCVEAVQCLEGELCAVVVLKGSGSRRCGERSGHHGFR